MGQYCSSLPSRRIQVMEVYLVFSVLMGPSLASMFSTHLHVDEYGVLYSQTETFDPTTRDIITHVPSHWRNGTFLHEVTKIENENLGITVWELKDQDICFLEDLDPEEHPSRFMLEVAYMEANNVTVNAAESRIVKFKVVDDGEWQGDRDELTEEMQGLCENIPIRKAHEVEIDETMGHRMKRQTRRARCCWCQNPGQYLVH